MARIIFLWCAVILPTSGMGCDSRTDKREGTLPTNSAQNTGQQPIGQTVILSENEEEGGGNFSSVVAAGAPFNVRCTVRLSGPKTKLPNPIIQIVRRTQAGREIVHNSAVVTRQRADESATFKGVINAPRETGAYRVKLIEAGKVFGAAPLVVK